MKPIHDPNSTKYPDRVFYCGHWMTQEKVREKIAYRRKYQEAHREEQRVYSRKWRKENPEKVKDANSRRIHLSAGGIEFHVGYAPTREAAEYLRKKIREEAPK